MRYGVTVPLINTGILSDVEMLLQAFKEKHSVRLVKFHEVAAAFELCNFYAGRINIPDLLEFEECCLRATIDYTRHKKESNMGKIIERTLTERIFGIYASYVLYYAQPSDYVSKIHVTPRDLVELKQFITDVLLPGRHLDTIGCIYKLLVDDAFSIGAFPKCFDPVCHRGYTLPFSPDDVIDEDERHAPLQATGNIMEHPVLKTMAHVQREMQLKQSQISDRLTVAEGDDNFLVRLNKIYSSLKRELDKVGVADLEESDSDTPREDNGEDAGATKNASPKEKKAGPSRSSIKDKAYGSSIQYARNRRYADPNMQENFPDIGNADGEVEEGRPAPEQQNEDAAPPLKKRRKPKPKPVVTEAATTDDNDAGEGSAEIPALSTGRQKVRAPKRRKGAAKALLEPEQPESLNTSTVVEATEEVVRVGSNSPRKPRRPAVDAEFEAEMKRIEALLDDSHSKRAKELLG